MNKKSEKILYASFDEVPQPKGAGTHILQWVKTLSEHYEVTLATPGKKSQEIKNWGVDHVALDVGTGNYLEQAENFRDRIDEHLRENNYDVVHFRGVWEGLPAIRGKNRGKYKTVFEANGFPSIELKYHFPAVAKDAEFVNGLRAMEMEASINADVLIVPSQVTKKFLIANGIAERKINVIPNGVDTDLFSPTEPPPALLPTLIYAGTLAPWQGLAHLLESFKAVLRQKQARLKIIGKPRKDWLKALAKQAAKLKIAEHVEFLEPVEHRELPNVLRKAHIGVAPFIATERNTRQGFCPIKIIEYMAMELAVVAPDLEAVNELVEHKKEAILYKPNSMARLKDTLIELIDNEELRNTLGANARKKAIENFTWKRSGEKLIEVYKISN